MTEIGRHHPFDARGYFVRVGHEWTEFFVREFAPAEREGHTNYAATWACNSSYGVFGHHWSSMGRPFAKFAAEIDEDYLLGKISKTEPDAEVTVASVRRKILTIRRNKDCTKQEAADAWQAVENLDSEYGNNEIFLKLREDADIGAVLDNSDWDFATTAYPLNAVSFVKKLWPEFVKALQENAGEESK